MNPDFSRLDGITIGSGCMNVVRLVVVANLVGAVLFLVCVMLLLLSEREARGA